MNFSVRIVNPPAGAAQWRAVWLVGATPQVSPLLPLSTTYQFVNALAGPGTIELPCFTAAGAYITLIRVTNVSPSEGSLWEGDFASGLIYEVTLPPPPVTYTVTISVLGQGTTDPAPGAYSVDEGAVVTIGALPAAGWQFDGWSGDVVSTINPLVVTVNSNLNLVANFSQLPPSPVVNFSVRIVNPPVGATQWRAAWTVGITSQVSPLVALATTYTFTNALSGPGTIEIPAFDAAGALVGVVLRAVGVSPSEGSIWEGDFASGLIYEVTPPPLPVIYTVSISVQGSGFTDPAPGTYAVNAGEALSILATPALGWQFDRWDGSVPSTANPVTITVTSDLNLVAVFSPIPPSPGTMTLVADVTTEETGVGMVEYLGDLYIAAHTNPEFGGPGSITRFNALTGAYGIAFNQPPSGQGLGDIKVLNGKIYVTNLDPMNDLLEIYIYDGSSWQIVTTSRAILRSMDIVVYQGRFYVAGLAPPRGASAGTLLSSPDALNWSEVYRGVVGWGGFMQMAEFNGKLFFTPGFSNLPAPMDNPYEIFSFDGTAVTPIDFTGYPMFITDIKVFNNALHLSARGRASDLNTPGMYRTVDGVNFEVVSFFGPSPDKSPNLIEMVVYNNRLYVAEYTPGQVNIYESVDGISWTLRWTVPATASTYSLSYWYQVALGVYGDRLYAMPPAEGKLYGSEALPPPPVIRLVTIQATAGGTTSPAPGTYPVADGSILSITALPDAGYSFSGWQDELGAIFSVDNPLTLVVNSDRNITAVFAALPPPPVTYTVTISVVGQGTTEPPPGTYILPAEAMLAAATIAILSTPDEYLNTAASELQTYLEKMSGQTWDIAQGDVSGPAIRLDVKPNEARLAGRNDEAVWLYSDSNGIRITGKTPIAARHGSYILLEKLGVRWFFAHPVWEVVPSSLAELALLDEVQEPAFLYRRIGYTALAGQGLQELWRWSKRSRVPGAVSIDVRHAYPDIIPLSEAQTNREWFCPAAGEGDPWQLNPLHPEVVSRAISYALNYLAQETEVDYNSADIVVRKAVSVSPQDGLGFCGDNSQIQRITDEVYFLANEVAKAVAAQFPDKYVVITNYSRYSGIPSFQLQPNLLVPVTTSFVDSGLPLGMRIQGILDRGAQVGIYDYFGVYGWSQGYPEWDFWNKLRRIKMLSAYGGTVFITETAQDWGPKGPLYYIASKLLWDPTLSISALMDDFLTKAFGPAAEPMRRYYERWHSGQAVTRRTNALALRDLDQAEALAAGQAEVLERIRQIQLYTVWLSWKATPLGSDAERTTFSQRIAALGLIDPFIEGFRSDPPFSASEVRQWMDRALAAHADLDPVDVQIKDPWSVALKPLGNQTAPALSPWVYNTGNFVVLGTAGQGVRVRIESGSIIWEDSDGVLLAYRVGAYDITLPTPKDGIYQLTYTFYEDPLALVPVPSKVQIDGAPAAMWVQQGVTLQSSGSAYFYVPPNSPGIVAVAAGITGDAGGTLRLYDPNGVVAVEGTYRGWQVPWDFGVRNPAPGLWRLEVDQQYRSILWLFAPLPLLWTDPNNLLVEDSGGSKLKCLSL